jgi:hypothetical protein
VERATATPGEGRRARLLSTVKSIGKLPRGTGYQPVPGTGSPSEAGPTIRRIVSEDLGGDPVPAKRQAEELLQIEEADAWFEYLEATRGQSDGRYGELEPWAWARLSQRLRAIRARRARLRPAAA